MRRKERREREAHEWLPPKAIAGSRMHSGTDEKLSKNDALARAQHELSKLHFEPPGTKPESVPPKYQFQPPKLELGKGLFNLDAPASIDHIHRKE
jgi:hypothetical protein